MKSTYERCYDHFIITRLCAMDLSIKERAQLVHQFFQNSSAYYDQLCDHLYFQAAEVPGDQSLWLAFDRQSYLSETRRHPADLCIMAYSDCPPFQDDIAEHLAMVCSVMQAAESGMHDCAS